MNALQLCHWQYSYKKNIAADFLRVKCNFRRKRPFCVFAFYLVPCRSYRRLLFKFWTKTGQFAFWGLMGNVRCSSYVHWKARNELPISVNWTFLAGCYGRGATSEYRLKIGVFARTASVWPKISDTRSCPPANHSSCRKTILSYCIRMRAQVSFVLSQCTHLTDRQTDRRTEGRTDEQKGPGPDLGGSPGGPGPQASHQKGASHQTLQFLFRAHYRVN